MTIVLVEVPAIAAADFDLHGVTRAIERINRALRQCAHGRANVAVCAPPAIEILTDEDHLYDGAYYDSVGRSVAEASLRIRFGEAQPLLDAVARSGDAATR